MSHGHDHAGAAGHGDAHGHAAAHDPHGAGAAAHHGPVEIPPAPAERSITPAPEDFRDLPGPTALAWPVLWMGLAALLVMSLLCGGWTPFHPAH
jgi:hypothetical protein